MTGQGSCWTNTSKKIKQQEASSGTNDETTELDNLLENIKESEVAHQGHAKNTLEKEQNLQMDAEKAQEIRQKAMESLSESRKRQGDNSDGKSPKMKRNNGSEMLNYLVNGSKLEIRKQEVELKKTEMELQRQQQFFIQQQMNQQVQLMSTMLEKVINK